MQQNAKFFYYLRILKLIKKRLMANIKEIHENVLQFLLKWREEKDKDLLFTLRRRPTERLSAGYYARSGLLSPHYEAAAETGSCLPPANC